MTPTKFEQWSFELARNIRAYVKESATHDEREIPEEVWKAAFLLEVTTRKEVL